MATIFGRAPEQRVGAPGALRGLRGERAWAMLFFCVIAGLILWPVALQPGLLLYHSQQEASDLVISHWPNALYIRDSLARFGQWPLWNAQIMAGQPFAGDPLAGLWYPPNLLLQVLPLPAAFNLLLALHIACAGYGLMRFVRAEGASLAAALLAGVAFACTPKLIAHIGAGHISLAFAVALTPWLLLSLRAASAQGGIRRGGQAGAWLALIVLADVRWAFYAGCLGLLYWLAALSWAGWHQWRSQLRAFLSFSLAVALLSAILILPLIEFLSLSRRAALSAQETAVFSLPVGYLLGLIVPDPYGFHEWMTYVGLVPLLLAVWGVRSARWPAARVWPVFWVAVAVAAAWLALGVNSVLYPLLLRTLPGLSFLRVPARAWFLVILALCVLAAYGFDNLCALLTHRLRTHVTPGLTRPALFAGLALLLVVNLVAVDRNLLIARPLPVMTPATAWLSAQPGPFRVYSPDYSLPLPDSLQHVDGIDPLYLAAYARFMEQASGIPSTDYSVTIPAFMDAPEQGRDAIPDARLLGLLNVRYVAAGYAVQAAGLSLVGRFGSTYVYTNTLARPRAWLEGEGTAQITRWTPDQIDLAALGPGEVVLSEIAYPGWRVLVDGHPAAIGLAHGLLRSVAIPAGSHRIVFVYQPASVYAGALLSFGGLLVVAWLCFRGRRRIANV